MPPVTTKTIGPLHHEDLEPRRFEDLVRQLVYDFRTWRMLEATGRAGSDDGFDVRGYELVGGRQSQSEEDQEDGEEGESDRLWLIQCKREKEIGPTKLLAYLDAIPSDELAKLDGIVFVAACDFSKKARDAFREKTRTMGVGEAHLWGKAEIEDQLFQPKNDHLLFAYFGISLQARRRSLRTEVRARLAMKRKALKLVGAYQPVLLRDASDDRYPWLDPDKAKPREERGRWLVRQVELCGHDGLHIVSRRHFAFLGDDDESWDFIEWKNEAELSEFQDPWAEPQENHDPVGNAARLLWSQVPDKNRGWYEVHMVLPYENILDIDFDGDDVFKGPQAFIAPPDGRGGPFRGYRYVQVQATGHYSRSFSPQEERRANIFPREAPPR